MVAFYNQKDQDIYKTRKYMPQSRFLFNTPTNTPLDFSNVSSSGIMTQAPIIYPLINQGGGNKPPGPTDPGSYDSQFDPNNKNEIEDFNYDIGVGTIAEEDDEEEGKIGKTGLAKIAGSASFGGPFAAAYTAYRERKKAKKKEIDKINAAIDAQYGKSDSKDISRSGASGRRPGSGGNVAATSANTNKETGTTYDSSGREGFGYGLKKGGRVGYFFGGRINYKTGGRIRFQGGGADMGAEDKAQERADKGYGNTGGVDRSAVGPGSTYQKNVNKQTSTVKNIVDAGSELNYLNNLKNLNLPGITLGFGVNKFRDFISNKKTKEEEDKLSYNTNNLPTNNYFTDLNAAQIKQLEGPQKMGKEYGNFSDQEILDNITPFGDEETAPATLKDVQTFYGSNGGRAMFKNGGLAGLL